MLVFRLKFSKYCPVFVVKEGDCSANEKRFIFTLKKYLFDLQIGFSQVFLKIKVPITVKAITTIHTENLLIFYMMRNKEVSFFLNYLI